MNRAILRLSLISAMSFTLALGWLPKLSLAKDTKEFEKCICGAKVSEAAHKCLNELRESYFQENKYSELVDLLRRICFGDKYIAPYLNYNIALSRYQQLKYLEESKGWDEYFAKGNDYRDDIVKEAGKAVESLPKDSPEFLYSKLVLYKFHKDQQDAFVEGALADLMSSAAEYAKAGKDISPVKEAADILLSYDEKRAASELYKLYSQVLVSSDLSDEALKEAAIKFYQEGNLELSESIYDIYIERISKAFSEYMLIQELKPIAVAFSYKDIEPCDMLYAEKIFKKIEESGGVKAFDEELMYMRGFNLEKNKEYRQAKDVYSLLLKIYPKSRYADEASFKAGVIFTYALRDPKSGSEYFSKLVDKEPVTAYSLSSLYQLGLLKQWEGDFSSAKGYYDKLIGKSQEGVTGILQLAKSRLTEIEEGASMEHNLKAFIDASLKKEFANLDMGKVDLKSDIYRPKSGESIEMSASVYLASSGCFSIDLQYLWSGDLEGANPGIREPGFKASYQNEGTKIVGLVLISPSGITDYAFDLIDVR